MALGGHRAILDGRFGVLVGQWAGRLRRGNVAMAILCLLLPVCVCVAFGVGRF